MPLPPLLCVYGEWLRVCHPDAVIVPTSPTGKVGGSLLELKSTADIGAYAIILCYESSTSKIQFSPLMAVRFPISPLSCGYIFNFHSSTHIDCAPPLHQPPSHNHNPTSGSCPRNRVSFNSTKTGPGSMILRFGRSCRTNSTNVLCVSALDILESSITPFCSVDYSLVVVLVWSSHLGAN